MNGWFGATSADDDYVEVSAEYSELLRVLFEKPSTVAMIPSGIDLDAGSISEEIAAEIGALDRRVVLVSVHKLLQMNPISIPEGVSFLPGNAPNVWLWPSFGPHLDVHRPTTPGRSENWLEMLRRNFHTVLLDCPPLGSVAGIAEVSAMADNTVLLVESERTRKQQVKSDQLALQLSGARLAGFILLHRT